MTLRSRLAWTYGVSLAVGMVLFAAISIFAIDATLRRGLDSDLTTAAQAAAVLADFHDGRLTIDKDDRAELQAMFGANIRGAIVDNAGNAVPGSPATLPVALPAPLAAPVAFDQGSGDGALRVVAVPIYEVKTQRIAGASLAWQRSDWIGAFEREAFAGMAVVAALILVAAIALAGALARRALRPLDRMSVLATEIEASDLSRRLNVSGNDELARLCAAFDRMLDRLQAAFARQQRFTADASHELRAPLSVIRAEADLALRKEREGDEYRRTLRSIAEEADRIEELVEALLLAARADAGAIPRHDVDLPNVARAVAEHMDASARARNVALRVSGAAQANIQADSESVQRALTAIVHNAIAWARPSGFAEIEILGNDGAVEAVVRDDGPGFSAEGLQHALERFWRGDSARTRGSTGLGLAIARALVEANGGTIVLANRPDGGAEVRLRFTPARAAFIG
jgi:signal transduction histidine kinase